jgi:hypothetical protein
MVEAAPAQGPFQFIVIKRIACGERRGEGWEDAAVQESYQVFG